MVMLESSKPFRNLNSTEMNALHQIARERTFSAGQEIFEEGDAGDGVYVVKEGLVEISVRVGQNAQRVFAQIGPGELFGEMAVLELKPRSATVTAAKDTVVYFIPRDALLAMVQRSPELSLELTRLISRRLREFNHKYIQEILQAERLAVIGRFARSIVHDLKNPLNIIGITAEMASTGQAPPEMLEKAAVTIRKQVDRIGEMISEILDFTQGSRADYVLGLTGYDTFVNQVLEEIRPEVELRGSQLILDGPVPSVRLPLDPKRVRRVFFNLVHNATDAMPGGGRIYFRFRHDGSELITEIEDTGQGIPPEIADRLFELFATYGKAHGTGLGLSICKKIIEDHHGRIWAANQPGRGAVFAFALPLQK